MNLNKLQTILELAAAELNDIARADQEQRMTAHARLGDALEAARRIGLPSGVDWCPERDGVDALAWWAERWRDAAQRPPGDEVDAWKARYLEVVRQRDTARSDAHEWCKLYTNVSKQPGVAPE